MKLFHSPNSCSLGIQVLLEEIGAPYELIVTDLKKGENRRPEYLALNPKGKVPALGLPDNSVLTEFPVIAYWLAKSFPEAGLLPDTLAKEIRVMELTEHIVSSIHMRGTVFIMVPQRFTPDAAAQEDLQAHGRAMLAIGYETLANQLGDQDYLFGEFTIADAAACYVLSWSGRLGVEVPQVLADYLARLKSRPSVAKVLAQDQA